MFLRGPEKQILGSMVASLEICKFLYQFNLILCPKWGKSRRDFEKDGDWNDALYPIGKGVKQAIEKVRLR
jgi:hypothetical protein